MANSDIPARGDSGKRAEKVPLGAYIKAVRAAKENPDRIFTTGLTTWWPTSGAEIVDQFCKGMMGRIDDGVPYSERAR